jgi:hypothetical protein
VTYPNIQEVDGSSRNSAQHNMSLNILKPANVKLQMNVGAAYMLSIAIDSELKCQRA